MMGVGVCQASAPWRVRHTVPPPPPPPAAETSEGMQETNLEEHQEAAASSKPQDPWVSSDPWSEALGEREKLRAATWLQRYKEG